MKVEGFEKNTGIESDEGNIVSEVIPSEHYLAKALLKDNIKKKK